MQYQLGARAPKDNKMPMYKDLDTTFSGRYPVTILGKRVTIRVMGQKFNIERNVNCIAWETLNDGGTKDNSFHNLLMNEHREEVEEQLQKHIDKRESYLSLD